MVNLLCRGEWVSRLGEFRSVALGVECIVLGEGFEVAGSVMTFLFFLCFPFVLCMYQYWVSGLWGSIVRLLAIVRCSMICEEVVRILVQRYEEDVAAWPEKKSLCSCLSAY